jgi:hypothetical protein
MLLDRDRPGDRGRATDMLETAAESYREMGMTRLAQLPESTAST